MSWKFFTKRTYSEERLMCLLERPVVTEKTTRGAEDNQYTFKVSIDATKPEVKAAVEKMFGVKVLSVNTLINKGKTKRFRGVVGSRSDFKKATVRLEAGQNIDYDLNV